MSASIYWKPPQAGVYIPCNTPSALVVALKLPGKFNETNMQFLRGVAAGNESLKKAITEILDAIEKHGEITVYAEY